MSQEQTNYNAFKAPNAISSESITTISTLESSINGDTETITDVLPSFHLHNFMLNRVLSSGKTGFSPPDYESALTLPEGEPLTIDSPYYDSYYDFSQKHNLVLENTHKLQKIKLPIKIDITLVNEKAAPGKELTTCNPLKHYLPGDEVNGYIIFENQSSLEIPFEMMLVSMEGKKGVREMKYGSWKQESFLKAYDLHASYNFQHCKKNNPHYDNKDDTYIGFKKRVLKPGIKIKKFFNFRIPEKLLDDKCKHNISSHLKVPVTYGVDENAFGGAVNGIIINSDGYGMLKAKGSPIKVFDFRGQSFCNYFINVEIIGKKLDVYTPFFGNNAPTDYNYISIANKTHHFRVGKNTLLDYEDTSFSNCTTDQLKSITNQAIDALEALKEREMLCKAGLNSFDLQSKIIYGTGKCKSKIGSIHSNSEKPSSKIKEDSDNFLQSIEVNSATGNFFAKSEGKLVASFEISKNTAFQSYFPKVIDILKKDSIYKGGINPRYKAKVKIKLEFTPSSSNKVKLPKQINIFPNLKYCRFVSIHGLPFTVDKEFLKNSSLDINEKLSKFQLYYKSISELNRKYGNTVEPSLLYSLKGLANCNYVESPLKSVFKHHTVNLQDKWSFDKKTGKYSCLLNLPIDFDFEYHAKHPHALLPPLQSCNEICNYKLEIGVCMNDLKEREAVTFPVTVV